MSEHLALPFYRGTFERRKSKGGGGFQPREDTKQFSEVQVFKLTKMKDDFKKDKEKLKQFFDPNLIFKVELQQKVNEEDFMREMELKLSLRHQQEKAIGFYLQKTKI